jgi:hypothetical protein
MHLYFPPYVLHALPLTTVVSDPDLYRLLTVHVPNFISPLHFLRCTEGSVRFQGLCVWFVTRFILYGQKLLAPSSTPKLEDHPFLPFCDYLFNIFAAILHICRPFLHPQPEDMPCRGHRDPLITVTGTHLSLWQGPTYHCDRDPLITDMWHLSSLNHFITTTSRA